MGVRLTAGFSNNVRIRPLMDGAVKPANIDLQFVISPANELFYRNLKFEEFDVMEMSIACALMAMERSDGVRWNWKGLPIFLSKSFLFINLYANSDSGIEKLEHLRGKKVGVPDYPMDAVLWLCILLKERSSMALRPKKWFGRITGPSVLVTELFWDWTERPLRIPALTGYPRPRHWI